MTEAESTVSRPSAGDPTAGNAGKDGGETAELLSFRIGQDDYCLDIMSVREIRSWTRTTSLPHAPEFVRGVINLRGTVLPVVDLALRLGLEPDEPNERSVIIVIDHSGRVAGLRVDAVSDILTVPAADMQTPPGLGAEGQQGFVKALTSVEDRMVRILDLEAVLPSGREAAA